MLWSESALTTFGLSTTRTAPVPSTEMRQRNSFRTPSQRWTTPASSPRQTSTPASRNSTKTAPAPSRRTRWPSSSRKLPVSEWDAKRKLKLPTAKDAPELSHDQLSFYRLLILKFELLFVSHLSYLLLFQTLLQQCICLLFLFSTLFWSQLHQLCHWLQEVTVRSHVELCLYFGWSTGSEEERYLWKLYKGIP